MSKNNFTNVVIGSQGTVTFDNDNVISTDVDGKLNINGANITITGDTIEIGSSSSQINFPGYLNVTGASNIIPEDILELTPQTSQSDTDTTINAGVSISSSEPAITNTTSDGFNRVSTSVGSSYFEGPGTILSGDKISITSGDFMGQSISVLNKRGDGKYYWNGSFTPILLYGVSNIENVTETIYDRLDIVGTGMSTSQLSSGVYLKIVGDTTQILQIGIATTNTSSHIILVFDSSNITVDNITSLSYFTGETELTGTKGVGIDYIYSVGTYSIGAISVGDALKLYNDVTGETQFVSVTSVDIDDGTNLKLTVSDEINITLNKVYYSTSPASFSGASAYTILNRQGLNYNKIKITGSNFNFDYFWAGNIFTINSQNKTIVSVDSQSSTEVYLTLKEVYNQGLNDIYVNYPEESFEYSIYPVDNAIHRGYIVNTDSGFLTKNTTTVTALDDSDDDTNKGKIIYASTGTLSGKSALVSSASSGLTNNTAWTPVNIDGNVAYIEIHDTNQFTIHGTDFYYDTSLNPDGQDMTNGTPVKVTVGATVFSGRVTVADYTNVLTGIIEITVVNFDGTNPSLSDSTGLGTVQVTGLTHDDVYDVLTGSSTGMWWNQSTNSFMFGHTSGTDRDSLVDVVAGKATLTNAVMGSTSGLDSAAMELNQNSSTQVPALLNQVNNTGALLKFKGASYSTDTVNDDVDRSIVSADSNSNLTNVVPKGFLRVEVEDTTGKLPNGYYYIALHTLA